MKLSGRKDPVLDEEEVSGLLREIFEESGARPNSVPLEALRAYTAYRRERFYILRGILAAILVLFFLMPFLFIEMKLTVSPKGPGFRKLPVYTLDVESPVPARYIKADMKQRQLPIYEESAKTYTVEPIRNGLLKIEVMGVNRQKASVSVEVTDVDSAGPKLLSGGEEDGLVGDGAASALPGLGGGGMGVAEMGGGDVVEVDVVDHVVARGDEVFAH